jgi:hypothetical protein
MALDLTPIADLLVRDAQDKTVHVIFECNCHIGKPSLWDSLRLSLGLTKAISVPMFASIWVSPRKLELVEDVEDYETSARKIAGPLPWAEAEALLAQLRELPANSGLRAAESTVADD